jgi:ribonucleoside-diphosphate reductase alpha chain
VRGLKTTYYLRTLAATSAEKSTGQGGELNAVPTGGGHVAAGASRSAPTAAEPEPRYCAIDDPTCEACQ